MPKVETNRREILARLEREGWISRGGLNHDVFCHPDMPGSRHREPVNGTACSIAAAAGWLKET